VTRRPGQPRRLLDGGAQWPGEGSAADLLGRSLPTPEPDDFAQKRIWRMVSAGLPGSGRPKARRWVMALATMTAATGAAMFIFLRNGLGTEPPARLELTAGTVLAAAPEGSWNTVEAGVTLPEATRLRTDHQSRAIVATSRSAVLLSPATDLALESLGQSTFLRLSGGEVVAQVEPRLKREAFVVQTTRYRVTVKGTIFSVRERAADDVSVSVSRGLVEVSGDGKVWHVPAGHSWQSRDPEAQAADNIPARDRDLLEPAAVPGPRSSIRVEGANDLQVSEGGVEIGPPPVTWDAPVGSYHFVGTASAGKAEGDATTSAGVPVTVRLVVTAPVVLAVDNSVNTPPAPKPSSEASTPTPPSAPLTVSAPEEATVQEHRNAPHYRTRKGSAKSESKSAPKVALALEPRASIGASSSTTTAPVAEQGDQTPWAAPPSITEPAPSPAQSSPTTPLPSPATQPQKGVAALSPQEQPQKPPTPAPAPQGQISTADAYSSAVALMHDGRNEDAAREFELIAQGHGAHAGLALVELARLRQRRLGDPDGALRAYLRYEKEYPEGALMQEVELSVIELRLERSDLAGALSQMDRFLDEHPNSEKAPEVHLLRGNVLRDRGDCKGAIREYRHVTGATIEDDALYFTAACQQKLGNEDEAAGTLRDYVTRFPSGRHLREAQQALTGR
jgi:TolA-binding protein